MDLLHNLGLGLSTAVSLENLAYCFIGCLLGTLVGVLPGIGPAATIAMLLPATFSLGPAPALIMMAGIYYGAQYGGSTTAILVNLPGESSSVVTTIDGYQMARQGRGGVALTTAALGSFFAGTVATLLIAVAAPYLADVSLSFGAPEYFSLMVLGLVGSVVLARGSLIKAFAMVILGLIIGLVGTDVNSGARRFVFGFGELAGGVSLVAVAMGMFGLAEIIQNLQNQAGGTSALFARVTSLMPSRADLRAMIPPILRGTALGSVLGVLPGGGALLSSFAAYTLEKKIARDPSRFGHGAIEGVAAPEAANNAGAQTSFIPLLTLGIPSNAIMALMAGAMIIQGIQPGPGVMTKQPELFFGLIASMWVGNVMLLVLNLPLVGIWVQLVRVPYRFLYPAILVFCAIGVFTINGLTFDIYLMAVFGVAGYIFAKLDCEPAPLLLGLILGPLMEEYFRRALLIARGDFTVFLTQPISAALLVMTAVAVIAVASPSLRKRRDEALQE
jgi:putative tricarboxylic transport membrane protein